MDFKDFDDMSPEADKEEDFPYPGRIPYGNRYDSNGMLRSVEMISESELFLKSELYQQKYRVEKLFRDQLVESNQRKQETLRVKMENDFDLAFAPDEILCTSNKDDSPSISPHPLSVCESYSWISEPERCKKHHLSKVLQQNGKEISALRSRLRAMELTLAKDVWMKNKSAFVDWMEKFAVRGLVCSSVYLSVGRIGYYLHVLVLSSDRLIKELAMVLIRSSLNFLTLLYMSEPSDKYKAFGCFLSIVACVLERISWKPRKSTIYKWTKSLHTLCTWMYFFDQYISRRIAVP